MSSYDNYHGDEEETEYYEHQAKEAYWNEHQSDYKYEE
jgi:hypothetical protein